MEVAAQSTFELEQLPIASCGDSATVEQTNKTVLESVTLLEILFPHMRRYFSRPQADSSEIGGQYVAAFIQDRECRSRKEEHSQQTP
jgi:hypothetical protein